MPSLWPLPFDLLDLLSDLALSALPLSLLAFVVVVAVDSAFSLPSRSLTSLSIASIAASAIALASVPLMATVVVVVVEVVPFVVPVVEPSSSPVRDEALAGTPHAAFRPLVWDRVGGIADPGGTLADHYGPEGEGRWNLDLSGVDPVLSMADFVRTDDGDPDKPWIGSYRFHYKIKLEKMPARSRRNEASPPEGADWDKACATFKTKLRAEDLQELLEALLPHLNGLKVKEVPNQPPDEIVFVVTSEGTKITSRKGWFHQPMLFFGAVKVPMPLPMTLGAIVRFIGDYVIGTMPGELTVLLADYLRSKSPVPADHTILVSYAQGHMGYLLRPEDWLLGGYEPSVTFWGPLAAEYVGEQLLQLMPLAVTPAREDASTTSATRVTTVSGTSMSLIDAACRTAATASCAARRW